MNNSLIESAMCEEIPKVTVITVVLNAAPVVERTLISVLAQDYPNLEYLVIDGQSTDGTLSIIEKYSHGITRWISEKDSGIWDAMNKAANLASGEWVIFMNAGDMFVASDVISRTFSGCKWAECDVIYGDGIYNYSEYRILERAPDIATLSDGAGFSHQSCFVKTALQKEYGFDLDEPIAADYDFFLRLHRAGKVFRRVDVVVSEFFFGGFSNRPAMEIIRMRHRIYTKYYSRSNVALYIKFIKQVIKSMAKTFIPKKIWEQVKLKLRRHNVLQENNG